MRTIHSFTSSVNHASQTAELKQIAALLCIERISAWMTSNRLKINPSKSEFLWFTTLLDSNTFALGDAEVRPADTIHNLRVHFDSYNSHNRLCESTRSRLFLPTVTASH